MSIVYYLMNEYVKKYRLKPLGPHRQLADKLFEFATSLAAIEEARKQVLEKYPEAAVETEATLFKRFIPRMSARSLRKLR